MTDCVKSRSFDLSGIRLEPCRFPYLLWFLTVVFLLIINAASQPYEDAISLVPATVPYFLDPVWYMDDIIGPAFFLTAGLFFLKRIKFRLSLWPLIGLGICCIGFALGDSIDAHWVVAKSMHAGDESISFSSWMSKVMVVICFYFFVIQGYDFFGRKAQKALIFAAVLLYIDQIQMSISLDFAGYSFHVFEETMEVVTSLFFCLGVATGRLRDPSATDQA